MKHTILLASCLAFALSQPARAQEPATPLQPSQSLVEQYRLRALEHLKAQRPDLKLNQLQLIEVNYLFHPASGSFPASELTWVRLLDPSSRTRIPRADSSIVTTQIIQVSFSRDGSAREEVRTYNQSRNEFSQ